MSKTPFHKKSTKELKEIIEGAGVGSNNWSRATQELNSRMDLKAKLSVFISVGALVVAALSWLFPRSPADNRPTPPTQEPTVQPPIE